MDVDECYILRVPASFSLHPGLNCNCFGEFLYLKLEKGLPHIAGMTFTYALSIVALAFTAVRAVPFEDTFNRRMYPADPGGGGSSCQGPEGYGTCKATSECNGISYPQNFCPNDPDDIQVHMTSR
jgi:hypothetical protein